MPAIDTVLIANRGEIAVRVIRACREMGRRAVAVFSAADREALHVAMADKAVAIGPAPALESYLSIERIIEAARRTGAQAVHPGYGFLSENARAAKAVEEAGLVWIGPAPATLSILSNKLEARALALRAGLPVSQGSEGPVSARDAPELAKRLGFPLLIKAAHGGGGKGIRVVASPARLLEDLAQATSEARATFGSETVYLDRWISPARHVEVQILGDGRGHAIHLGERECSLQRRNQKVVEETPSPAPEMTPELRRGLTDAAVALARGTNYRGAGTVEFLLDRDGRFYFLEVNARLQVEHPITEMVTGLDVVKMQLEIAETGRLRISQEEWSPRGHAIELRVNAEDPFAGFVASTGRVRGLRLPHGPFVRVDTGLFEGMEVTPWYDSLLAKVAAWGRDRTEAISRLTAAVGTFRLSGVRTTLPLLPILARDPEFRAAAFHTQWLVPWIARTPASGQTLEVEVAALAAALHAERSAAPGAVDDGSNGTATPSPWVLQGRRET